MDKLSFWPNCALSDKSTKIGRGRFVCFELIRCGATVGSGGLAYFQIWSKAETFQRGRTYFISEPKWPLLNTKQLWPPQVLLFNASLIS